MTAIRSATSALVGLGLMLGACTPPCEPGSCELPRCGGEVQARLTRGDAPDEPWTEGDGIVMVHGPQGGWHLSLGVQVVDPDPFVILDITVQARDTVVVDNHYELVLDDHDGCTGAREDLYGFLDVRELAAGDQDTPPELLAGEALLAELQAVTSTGQASYSIPLLAELDPDDRPTPD